MLDALDHEQCFPALSEDSLPVIVGQGSAEFQKKNSAMLGERHIVISVEQSKLLTWHTGLVFLHASTSEVFLVHALCAPLSRKIPRQESMAKPSV